MSLSSKVFNSPKSIRIVGIINVIYITEYGKYKIIVISLWCEYSRCRYPWCSIGSDISIAIR